MRVSCHRIAWLGFALASFVGAVGCSSASSSPSPSGTAGGNAQSGNGASNAGSAGMSASGGTAGISAGGGSAGISAASGNAGTSATGGNGNPNGGASGMSATGGTGGGAAGTAGAAVDMSGPDSASGEAFNPQTGMLNVHYSEFMPKHDIVYNKANTNPLYGLTVGNGHVGAMVWSQNGLTMQVANVDDSQQNALFCRSRQSVHDARHGYGCDHVPTAPRAVRRRADHGLR